MKVAPCAEVTRLSGGLPVLRTESAPRRGIMSSARACRLRRMVSAPRTGERLEGGWGQAFQCASVPRGGNISFPLPDCSSVLSLFHARGARLHVFDAFLCTWRLVKQSRGALLRNDGLSVYGAASEVRFSGFAGNFPRVRRVCPALMKRRCPSGVSPCGGSFSLCMASDCACCGFPPVWGEFFVKVKGVHLKV